MTSLGPFLGEKKATTYVVDDIDKRLGVVSLKTAGQFDRLPAREDFLDKRGESTLREGAADQTS